MAVLGVGGPVQGREQVHLLNQPGNLMKTSIRLIKRDDRKVSQDVAIPSASTDRQRMTEVIVNSWIIEFRERRRCELSRLRSAVVRK